MPLTVVSKRFIFKFGSKRGENVFHENHSQSNTDVNINHEFNFSTSD